MGSLIDYLIAGAAGVVLSSTPKGREAAKKLQEGSNNLKEQARKQHDRYVRQAESMSTERLKEAYKNLDREKDPFKKSAYAEVLKKRL